MKITKIEPCGGKSTFFKLYADGEYQISLPTEIIKRFKLKEGVEIDTNELSELSSAALVRRARERLLYSLDRRLHSEKELRQKLRQDYPPHIIDLAIDELAGLGLVDDRAFAKAFAEQRLRVNKKGPYAILQELYQKGVDHQTAKEVIDELFAEGDGQLEAARAVSGKYLKNIDTPQGKQRLYAALARRGFNYSIIKQVMREACDNLEEFEE